MSDYQTNSNLKDDVEKINLKDITLEGNMPTNGYSYVNRDIVVEETIDNPVVIDDKVDDSQNDCELDEKSYSVNQDNNNEDDEKYFEKVEKAISSRDDDLDRESENREKRNNLFTVIEVAIAVIAIFVLFTVFLRGFRKDVYHSEDNVKTFQPSDNLTGVQDNSGTICPTTLEPNNDSMTGRTVAPSETAMAEQTLYPNETAIVEQTLYPSENVTIEQTLYPSETATVEQTLYPSETATVEQALYPSESTMVNQTMHPNESIEQNGN